MRVVRRQAPLITTSRWVLASWPGLSGADGLKGISIIPTEWSPPDKGLYLTVTGTVHREVAQDDGDIHYA